jgi:Sulfotransferase domain
MIHRVAYGIKHTLGLDRPRYHLKVYPDDTFVVSFPGSGNNWTLCLIANLLQLESRATLLDIERLIPATDGQTRKFFRAMPRPRVIRHHESFDPQYKKVIYMVRDPRDVIISAYNSALERTDLDRGDPFMSFVAEFVSGARSAVGSWGENVASWVATRGNTPRFLLLRYEDMVSETTRELKRVAGFLGIPATTEHLAEAVNRSSVEDIDRLEQMQSVGGNSRTAGRKEPVSFPLSPKGGWQTTLPKAAVSEIESAWGPLMSALGYELCETTASKCLTAEVKELDRDL